MKNLKKLYEEKIPSLLEYINDHGIKIKPYPKVTLKNDRQDGLFIRTGYYNPDIREVVIFVNDRHPKDVLRSLAHEMIHHHQNLEGRLVGYSGDKITEDNKLMPLEEEAYKKGNVIFRSWTEDEQKKTLNETIYRKNIHEDMKKTVVMKGSALKRLVLNEARRIIRESVEANDPYQDYMSNRTEKDFEGEEAALNDIMYDLKQDIDSLRKQIKETPDPESKKRIKMRIQSLLDELDYFASQL